MKFSIFVFAFLFMCFTIPAQKNVFICTDIKSQIYHYEELCKELEKCKYEVKKVKENEAKDQEKRLCKVCKENEEKKAKN
ncbi:MAG TPA: hypothetical protein PK323_05240 [Bacteroidia bacterium]|nr:hypothetical protein [Bacteroidia bacterium]